MNARVLVVDDEEAIRSTMKQAIDYAGHDCLLARSGQEGLDVVERESPDVGDGRVGGAETHQGD